MSTLRQQVAEPQVKPTRIRTYTTTYPCQFCAEGRVFKRKTKMCWECFKNSKKPPIIDEVFWIEGEPCRKIPLTQDKYATVYIFDYGWLMRWSWCAMNQAGAFYAGRTVSVGGKRLNLGMQRAILDAPSGMEVDHINGDTLDYRRSNLRIVTKHQNGLNRKKKREGTSKYKGVSFVRGKWRTRITMHERTVNLGYSPTEIRAARVYDAAAVEYHGEFARLNFPEEWGH